MESPSRKAWEHLRPCPFSLHAEGASIVPWAPTAAGLCSGLGSLFSPASPRSKINSPYCGKVSWWALPILYRIGLGSAGSLSGWAMSHRPHEHCLSGKALPRGPLGPGIPDPEFSPVCNGGPGLGSSVEKVPTCKSVFLPHLLPPLCCSFRHLVPTGE